MKGDFTRVTFRPERHFSQVLFQQGRVQLDADWNEQGAIVLHHLRTAIADLIGPFATPSTPDGKASEGFRIQPKTGLPPGDFTVGIGHYYVDGILCENPKPGSTYLGQPDHHPGPPDASRAFLAYLDVWERHVTEVQYGLLREVALGGPDTATRAQVVWQVRIESTLLDGALVTARTTRADVEEAWEGLVQRWQPEARGELLAQALLTEPDTDPCRTPPGSRYRGAENQLYRVEIHRGGPLADATFKWSRDNGSLVFPVLDGDDPTFELDHLGRDDRSTLRPGDTVEVVTDLTELVPSGGPLRLVDSVDVGERLVTLAGPGTVDTSAEVHPLLRRWDHRGGTAAKGEPGLADDGALRVEEGKWLTLEDGVQVQFTGSGATQPNTYRSGDYWLIPARTATGDVEWPPVKSGGKTVPKAMPPHGVEHHFAPLAIVVLDGDRKVKVPVDLRRRVIPLSAPV